MLAIAIPSVLFGAITTLVVTTFVEPPLPLLEPIYYISHRADSVPFFLAHTTKREAMIELCEREGLPTLYCRRCTNALIAQRMTVTHDASPVETALLRVWGVNLERQ
jgi:hypothetical protein